MDYYPATGRNHLFVPGPSNIPESVQRAMTRNNEDHRSPAFPIFSKSLLDDVKKIFKTQSATPFIFPSTGTGAWEISLTNTLSPGDKVLAFRNGQFAVLWIRMMQRLNLAVDVVDTEWGTGVDLRLLKEKLEEDSNFAIRAVCIIHNETSTGVTNDLAAVRSVLDACNHPALLLVDGISSIGALDFRMDEWRVDVAITGSQKALGLPTGLGIVCASMKAIEASKTSKSIKAYFDWGDYIDCYRVGSYWPYTPSGHLLYGLRAALDLILEEGVDNVIKRHHRLGHATRLAVKAWGLQLCTRREEWYSDTVTAVLVPPHISSTDVVKLAWRKYNLSLGVGLNEVAGKVFRIGHLGFINELQLLAALAGVEMTLRDIDYPLNLGSGVGVAAMYLQQSTPIISSRL